MRNIITPKWILTVLLGLLFIAALLFLTCDKAQAQTTLNIGAGYYEGGKFTGGIGVGYDYKQFVFSTDMRTNAFSNGAFFGTFAGYQLPIGEFSIIPYTGIWYHYQGNSHPQDRYVSNGHTTVLYDNLPVNESVWGGGVRFQWKIGYIEVARVGGLQMNFGLRYKFE